MTESNQTVIFLASLVGWMDESQAICPLRFLLRKPSFVEEKTPFDKAMLFDLREAILRKEPRLGADLMCGDFEKKEVLHYSHKKGSFTHSLRTDGAAATCIALFLAWTIDNRFCQSIEICREISIGSDKAIVLDGITHERTATTIILMHIKTHLQEDKLDILVSIGRAPLVAACYLSTSTMSNRERAICGYARAPSPAAASFPQKPRPFART